MKTPIIIIVGVCAVLALSIYFLVTPQTGTIADSVQSSVFNNSNSGEDVSGPAGENKKMKIIDETIGTGNAVKSGDTVRVHYRGTLENGTEFDSSYKRNEPFSFTVGAGQVIQGWEQGLVGMQVGGKRKLTIPPELGYGAQGAGAIIPPNATLIFEIELIEIK